MKNKLKQTKTYIVNYLRTQSYDTLMELMNYSTPSYIRYIYDDFMISGDNIILNDDDLMSFYYYLVYNDDRLEWLTMFDDDLLEQLTLPRVLRHGGKRFITKNYNYAFMDTYGLPWINRPVEEMLYQELMVELNKRGFIEHK